MGKSSNGQNLCQDGSVNINFTTFNWPIGTKMDRGLNISFPGDVTLWPSESITGSAGSNDVMISFKDAKKLNPYRFDFPPSLHLLHIFFRYNFLFFPSIFYLRPSFSSLTPNSFFSSFSLSSFFASLLFFCHPRHP